MRQTGGSICLKKKRKERKEMEKEEEKEKKKEGVGWDHCIK